MRVQLAGRRRADEKGAVALLVATLTLVLLVVLAFVTDFGVAYANKRVLQSGVDSAALAIGNDLALNAPAHADCPAMAALAMSNRSNAEQVFRQNEPNTSVTLEPGTSGFDATCQWSGPTQVLVLTTRAGQDSPAFFGGVTGADHLRIAQQSRVIVGPVGKIMGLRPFGLCKTIADMAAPPFPNAPITLDLDNADAGCGSAPGNFGALDLSNGHGHPSSDIYDWVEYGYPAAIPTTTPFTFQPSTGNPATNFEDELVSLLGESVVLPVYDSRSGPGNNATYNIVSFAAIQICAVKTGVTAHTDPCANPGSFPVANNARFLQFRFVRYVPPGEVSITCSLGTSCDSGLRVAQLAE